MHIFVNSKFEADC